MKGSGYHSGQSPRTSRTLLRTVSGALLLTTVIVGIGVALVAILGQQGSDRTWARWSDIGEAFGVIGSVVSAFAVGALVATSLAQSREQRRQHNEVALREMHVHLISLALNKPELAELWPSVAGADPRAKAQHMYANLVLQHIWVQYTSGVSSYEEMVNNLRLVFAAPAMRAYWRDSRDTRQGIYVPGSREATLASVADAIWREYEALLAQSTSVTPRPMETNPTLDKLEPA